MGFSLLALTPKGNAAGASGYVTPAGSRAFNSSTEAARAVAVGVAGVVGSAPGGTRVNINATGTDRVITSRVNSSDGNIAVIITDGVSGYFSDTINYDTISAGATFDWSYSNTGSPTYTFLVSSFAATVNHASIHAGTGASAASVTPRYWTFGGVNGTGSTTDGIAHYIGQAVTAKYFNLHVSANASALTSTARVRKNFLDGSGVITVGAGATGLFKDTTHTDSLAVGDYLNMSWVNGDTGSVTIAFQAITLENTSGNKTNDVVGFSIAQTVTDTTGAVQYFGAICGESSGSLSGTPLTTEADAQIRHGFDVTASSLRFLISSNNLLTTSTFVSRVNGANGNMSVSVGAGVTGWVSDATNTDTLGPDDDYCWMFVSGASTGGRNIQLRGCAVTETDITAAAIPDSSTETTLYAASIEFGSRPDDTPAGTPFLGTLSQPLNFRRSLLGSDLIGAYTTGDGVIRLDNTDGQYDYLIGGYAIDGREIAVKIGVRGALLSSYFTIFRGTAYDWQLDDSVLSITARDFSYKLNLPALPNTYGGGGGADGDSNLAGKRKPRGYGYCQNIDPVLLNDTYLVYQITDGLCTVSKVYDQGVEMTLDSNYADYDALIAAALSAGTYATCTALGLIRLESTPAGDVRCNASCYEATYSLSAPKASEIVKIVTATTAGLTYPDDFYVPSFSSVGTAQPATNSYYLELDSQETVADICSNVMAGIGGWAGFRRNGLFEVGIFNAPTSASVPSARYDTNDILSIRREQLPGGMSPPPWRQRLAYGLLVTTQAVTDLAAAAPSALRLRVTQKYLLRTSTDLSVLTYHPFAKDPDVVISYITDATTTNVARARAEAYRRQQLYGTLRALYRFKLPPTALKLNLGEVVNITYPRWDLTDGRNLTVVETSWDASNNTFEVVGYG